MVLESYQDRICGLAHDESNCGKFLKECGKVDKTRAGKMMTASGKTLCYSAQQRIHLRSPLVRLYQEVETFQYRAVSDTLITINKMEKARTGYRAALLWMKDASQQLDPDTYKQLDKFRKVQSHVRRTKARFDKFKLDTLQKVDLLSASRCNMYSHALVAYQTALLQFWEKTSKTMSAVADSFKGYQYFEFTMLKELSETSKKLAEDNPNYDDIIKIFEDTEEEVDKDRLIFFEADYRDDDERKLKKESNFKKTQNIAKRPNLSDNKPKPIKSIDNAISEQKKDNSLLDLTFDTKEVENKTTDGNQENESEKHSNIIRTKDILTSSDLELDDLTILNEILNAPTTPPIDANQALSAMSASKSELFMMPSQLLDLDHSFTSLYLNPVNSNIPKNVEKPPMNTETDNKASNSKKKDISSWYNLFADLDPLANPDAIGKKTNEADDRNC